MNENFIHILGMSNTKDKNRQIRQDQRSNILAAASRVFARKGPGTTIVDVAIEAGISQGLAYRYFPSKEAIFTTLIDQMLRSPNPLATQIQDIPGTPMQRIDYLISKVMEPRRDNPEFYQFLYQALNDEKLPFDLRNIMERNGRAFQDTLLQLIIEGQATGEIAKDDPAQLLEGVMACLEGMWRRMAMPAYHHSKEHFPDSRIVLRLLKPDRE